MATNVLNGMDGINNRLFGARFVKTEFLNSESDILKTIRIPKRHKIQNCHIQILNPSALVYFHRKTFVRIVFGKVF